MSATSPDEGLRIVLGEARSAGLLGRGPVQHHVDHARALIEAVPEDATRFVDLGSGGGVPGLILAVDRPDLEGVLLDGSTRRGAFLSSAVQQLGLAGRIAVLVERAEVAGRSPRWRGRADVVLARSFGPPAVVAEGAAPLLVMGGRLIVSDPPSEQSEGRRWPAEGLEPFGLSVLAHHGGPPAFTVLEQVVACPERFPRRVGIPAKRPLF